MLPKARGKQGSYPIPLNKDWKARVDNAGGAQALILRTYRWQDHDHRYTDDTPENRHSATCLLLNAHRITALKLLVWSKPRPEHSFVHATRMMILYSKRNSAASDRSTAIGECESEGWRGVIRGHDFVTIPAPRMTSLRNPAEVYISLPSLHYYCAGDDTMTSSTPWTEGCSQACKRTNRMKWAES